MNNLLTILRTFSKEDSHNFLLWLKRKNRRGDVKNSTLFKLLLKGQTKDLDIILYGKPSRNAFHALCKRLQDALIDFVASKSFAGETSEELEILKLLLASRIFFEQKQFKIAFRTLEKAESKATEHDLHALLNEIYHTKIQYAHHNNEIDLGKLIQTSEVNMERFQQDFKLNMAYASIKQGLKHSTDGLAVNEIIERAFSNFDIVVDDNLTYRSLYQLMNITATAAKLQRDYYTISPFMMQIYGLLSSRKKDVDKHRYYHLEVLNLMAVTHFRNKNFKDADRFVQKMKVEMQKGKGAYYNRFIEKLTVIKALNYNYTGHFQKALDCLGSFKGDSFDIQLILIMTLFQQNEFGKAYQILKGFSHSDVWYEKKMGWLWVLKKNIIEILLLIELDRFDLVSARLHAFRRKFTGRLTEMGETRVLTFIKLVEQYYDRPKEVHTSEFKEKVEQSFHWIGVEREDIFVMSFYAWLKAKMEKKDLYGTTLQLVG